MRKREFAIGLAGLVLGFVLGWLRPFASTPRAADARASAGAASVASAVDPANARTTGSVSTSAAPGDPSMTGTARTLPGSVVGAAEGGDERSTSAVSQARERSPAGAAGEAAPPARGAAASARAPEESAQATAFPPDKDGISRAVDSVTPAVKQCYEGWYRQNKQLSGKVVVNITIDRDPNDPSSGIVTRAETADTALHHAPLEGCLQNALSELKFQRPDETILASLPFQFGGPDSAPAAPPPSQPAAAAATR